MLVVDLRSDTVTQPTPAMRKVMASAEVGDDVFGDDPSANLLQETIARLMGKERALFVPSGTMANQVAIAAHTSPGDEVLVGEWAHSYLHESGAGAVVSGVQYTVVGRRGFFTAEDVKHAMKPDDCHFTPTRLIMVENSHNHSGGRVFPYEELKSISRTARTHGLRLHMD